MGRAVHCLILMLPPLAAAASAGPGEPWPFPWPESRIARYTARRTAGPIVVDGRLDEAGWQAAERSPRFSDLVRGAPGIHDTRAAVLWDDQYLYVAYWVEEPFVEGTLTERDSLIYKNNDVELFIAGRDAYYELEINSLGTIYEVFFIWEETYERAGYARLPEFDRGQDGVRPFRGVGFKTHPRGPRIGYWKWDLPGLRTAVQVDGTVNDSSDRDRGWTVELGIPWTGLAQLARPDGRSLPPKDGDVWRMDFSRFNQYKEAPPAQDPGGWAWSPHGAWDSHIPEVFPYVRFSARPVVAGGADVAVQPAWAQSQVAVSEPAPRWFKGNTHAHTTNSDGDSPPEVVTRWYQDHGYNFLVLSDHNYLTAEGSFPYSRRDDFILIQGEEVTAFYRPSETDDKRPIHVNARAALMDALEKGEFYASTGVTLRDVRAGREALTVSIAVESDFQYTTRFLGPGGAVLATCVAVDCVYRFSGREGYVRASVTDSGGRRAWVQPVFRPASRSRRPHDPGRDDGGAQDCCRHVARQVDVLVPEDRREERSR
jgi:hypothetical protein